MHALLSCFCSWTYAASIRERGAPKMSPHKTGATCLSHPNRKLISTRVKAISVGWSHLFFVVCAYTRRPILVGAFIDMRYPMLRKRGHICVRKRRFVYIYATETCIHLFVFGPAVFEDRYTSFPYFLCFVISTPISHLFIYDFI